MPRLLQSLMRRLFFLPLLLLILPFTTAQNLYQQDSLELRLDVKNVFELIAESSSADVQKTTAQLFLFPQDDLRQKVISLDTPGIVSPGVITFTWSGGDFGKKQLEYSAIIRTNNQRVKVQEKIPFPLPSIDGYDQYTLPSPKIDSDNPAIIQQAAELAEGETDEFKVVFKTANWVAENVDYNLNELTTNVAQKASWVLQHKEGVCDEMTSLFVAMLRSMGIPARFVSGISYTENEEVLRVVGKKWAPHGWAEVYFPHIGWVSFDITFDEYGYIDVTHIKLREGLDPDESGIIYQVLSRDVTIKTNPLDLDVKTEKTGSPAPDEIVLHSEIIASETGFGSYNLVTGIIENKAGYYNTVTLKIAIPSDLGIIGQNKRTILLSPHQTKETYWVVKVPENLDNQYLYTFPVILYSEKNVSLQSEFAAQTGGVQYSLAELQEIALAPEEKTYSSAITFACDYPFQIKLGQTADAVCTVKNAGNKNLHQLSICLGEVCTKVDLPINQEEKISTTIIGEIAGWYKIVLNIKNEVVEKKSTVQYTVFDPPQVDFSVRSPERVDYGDTFSIHLDLNKTSFTPPEKVTVAVSGLALHQQWQIEKMLQEQAIDVSFPGDNLARKNKIEVKVSWEDTDRKSYEKTEELIILGEADTFLEEVKLFFNGVINQLLPKEDYNLD